MIEPPLQIERRKLSGVLERHERNRLDRGGRLKNKVELIFTLAARRQSTDNLRLFPLLDAMVFKDAADQLDHRAVGGRLAGVEGNFLAQQLVQGLGGSSMPSNRIG